jgi:hypothetical protein
MSCLLYLEAYSTYVHILSFLAQSKGELLPLKVGPFRYNLGWGPELRKANPAKFGSYWSCGF